MSEFDNFKNALRTVLDVSPDEAAQIRRKFPLSEKDKHARARNEKRAAVKPPAEPE